MPRRAPASPGGRARAQPGLMLAVRVRALLTAGWHPRSRMCWRWPRPVLRHRMAVTFAARAEGIASTT